MVEAQFTGYLSKPFLGYHFFKLILNANGDYFITTFPFCQAIF